MRQTSHRAFAERGAPETRPSARAREEMKGMGKSKETLQQDFDQLPEEDKAARTQKAKELETKYAEEVVGRAEEGK